MTDSIKATIQMFKDDNGNKEFTNKDLIMYAIARIDKLDENIEEKFNNLPCAKHVETIYGNATEITKLKTTNKVLAAVVIVTLTIFGLVIGLANFLT